MDRFRKFYLYFVSILFINCLHIYGQNISIPFSDDVFCYLTIDKKVHRHNSYNLLIYNCSKDSVIVEDFNKYIYHVSAFHFNRIENRVFFWDLMTLSNQEPKDVVTIFPNTLSTKIPKRQMEEKNKTIIVPPDNLFVSDIYMLSSPFIDYPKGYYKLCLYYEKSDKHIAEIVIKIE